MVQNMIILGTDLVVIGGFIYTIIKHSRVKG